MGLHPPGVEVRFQNLNVSCNVNVGSRTLPTLTNSFMGMMEVSSGWGGGAGRGRGSEEGLEPHSLVTGARTGGLAAGSCVVGLGWWGCVWGGDYVHMLASLILMFEVFLLNSQGPKPRVRTTVPMSTKNRHCYNRIRANPLRSTHPAPGVRV